MLERDLDLLTDAVRAGGKIALRHWQRNPKVWDKGGGEGPVTEADLAVNDALAKRLREARPDYGWLSEEGPDDPRRGDCTRVFILDPIDGTRAFIAGERSFSVSLAVAEAGRIVAAAVYLPADDVLYAASADGPATRNGQPIAASGQTDLAAAQVLASASAVTPEHWPGGLPPFRRSFRASLAWRLCLVAEGAFDAMVTPRLTWEWDIAAGSLIAERAGATVSDANGGALAFNRPVPRADGVICAAPALHAGFVAARQVV